MQRARLVLAATLVLTALHVLDELAKFKRVNCLDTNTSYTGRELPAHVTGVKLYDPYAANWMLSAAVAGLAGILISPIVPLVPAAPVAQSLNASARSTGFTPRASTAPSSSRWRSTPTSRASRTASNISSRSTTT